MKMYLCYIKIKDCRNRTHLKELCVCVQKICLKMKEGHSSMFVGIIL